MSIILEACVDSPESAITAANSGAERIELCTGLSEGGLTPSMGIIKETLKCVKINLNILLRPRGGDFYYSNKEFEVIKEDLLTVKTLGCNGVVIGILNPDATIDTCRTSELIELARPMDITFHRAFDMTSCPLKALDDLLSLGIDRILTSGQSASAIKGSKLIKKLNVIAKEKIIIMPGGGINESNVQELIRKTGVKEIHASARSKVKSKMKYKNLNCSMGKKSFDSEYTLTITDKTKLKNIVQKIKEL